MKYFILNGTFKVLPDNCSSAGQGYIGNVLCNGETVFDGVVPTITVSFSKVFTELIPGISIVWSNNYNEYATKVRITAYAEGVITYQNEFKNNTVVSVFNADIDNYDTITVEKWTTI